MTNMRVLLTGDSSAVEFAASLLKLGNGAMTNSTNRGLLTQLPGTMQTYKSVDTVLDTN